MRTDSAREVVVGRVSQNDQGDDGVEDDEVEDDVEYDREWKGFQKKDKEEPGDKRRP